MTHEDIEATILTDHLIEQRTGRSNLRCQPVDGAVKGGVSIVFFKCVDERETAVGYASGTQHSVSILGEDLVMLAILRGSIRASSALSRCLSFSI